MTGPPVASEGRDLYVVIGAFAAVVYTMILVFPAMTAQLTVQFSLSPSRIGLLASAEV